MRKIVLDTNCLLMSLPRISPYRKISWSYYCGIKETIILINSLRCRNYWLLQVVEGTHLGLLQVFTTPSVPLVGNRNPQGRGRKPLLLVARNRYALRLADHQRSRQIVRDGTAEVYLWIKASWIVEVCWGGDVCAAWGIGAIRGEDDCSDGWEARKVVVSRDTEWWQLWTALHQVWAFYTTRHGKEVFSEDMEKYALREIFPCWGSLWAYLQNMAFLLEA